MVTLLEVEDRIDKLGDNILFHLKVLTSIVGVGIIGVGLAVMVQTWVMASYHETVMREFRGMRVTQTVTNERATNREDLIQQELQRVRPQ